MLTGLHGKAVGVESSTIKLTKKGWLFASQREKAIPIRNITSVEVKKPGVMAGFIQFSVAGDPAKGNFFKVPGGAIDALQDENSVAFHGKASYETALRIQEHVKSYTEAFSTGEGSPASKADEIGKFKVLFDQGIISRPELEAETRRLLGGSDGSDSTQLRRPPPPIPQNPESPPAAPSTAWNSHHRLWILILLTIVIFMTPLFPQLSLLIGASLLLLCVGAFVPQLKMFSYGVLKIDSKNRQSRPIRVALYGMLGVSFLVFGLASFATVAEEKNKVGRTTRTSTAQVGGGENTLAIGDALNELIVPRYRVLEDESLHTFKRSVVIRVPTRYTESQVRAMAREIKNKDTKKYDRTFIEYYLPEMKVGAGAWATSHYDPDMEIVIYGLSVQEYGILTSVPLNPDPAVKTLGRWITRYSLAEILLVNDDYLLRETFPDGSTMDVKLKSTEATEETRYYETDRSYESYFVIANDRSLTIFDGYDVVDGYGQTFTPSEAKKEFLPKPIETPIVSDFSIVCDKFEIVANLTGSILELSIDTDLPDNTDVSVSVGRHFVGTFDDTWEKGRTETWSITYFDEEGTTEKWRETHSISLDSENWKEEFRAKQLNMIDLGIQFDAASISDSITVRFLVPMNQSDPKFGSRNENLGGKALTVDKFGFRVVESEMEINYPTS